MAADITDTEWSELSHSEFETTDLLRAVDAVDGLRGELNAGEAGQPPQLRSDLLKLHQLAMAVFNDGSRDQVAELFEWAVDLEGQVSDLTAALEQVQVKLSKLTDLYPESLSYQ